MAASKRVAVVTGANRGIGFAIVKELCRKFDGTVYLTSREEERGKEALCELAKLDLHPHYHQLDVEDEASIGRMRDYLKAKYGGLDVLVNNAGAHYWADYGESFHKRAVMTLNVIFYGTYRTTEILFPILRPHARVVNVSSSAGHSHVIPSEELRAKFTDPDLTYEKLCDLMQDYIKAAEKGDWKEKGWPDENPEEAIDRHKPASAYKVAKVGLCALTRIQQREFNKDPREDLIVNCVHPGYVGTDMTAHQGVRSIEEGAEVPVWLTLLPPNVPGPKGEFLWYDKNIVDWVNGPERPS